MLIDMLFLLSKALLCSALSSHYVSTVFSIYIYIYRCWSVVCGWCVSGSFVFQCCLSGVGGHLVGEYDRCLGEYGRLVGEYDRLIGEYSRLAGEYGRCVGEYVLLIGQYSRLAGEYGRRVLLVSMIGWLVSVLFLLPLCVRLLESCVGFVGGCINLCLICI